MKRRYDARLQANIVLDEANRLRAINHLDAYRESGGLKGRAAAAAYLRELSTDFGIGDDALRHLERMSDYLDPKEAGLEYRRDEKAAVARVRKAAASAAGTALLSEILGKATTNNPGRFNPRGPLVPGGRARGALSP